MTSTSLSSTTTSSSTSTSKTTTSTSTSKTTLSTSSTLTRTTKTMTSTTLSFTMNVGTTTSSSTGTSRTTTSTSTSKTTSSTSSTLTSTSKTMTSTTTSSTGTSTSTSTSVTQAIAAELRGSLRMEVSDPESFVRDPQAAQAVADVVADLAGVPQSYVSVSLALVDGAGQGRRLAAFMVYASYVISIPANEVGSENISDPASIAQKLAVAETQQATVTAWLIIALKNRVGEGVYEATVENLAVLVVDVLSPTLWTTTSTDAVEIGATTGESASKEPSPTATTTTTSTRMAAPSTGSTPPEAMPTAADDGTAKADSSVLAIAVIAAVAVACGVCCLGLIAVAVHAGKKRRSGQQDLRRQRMDSWRGGRGGGGGAQRRRLRRRRGDAGGDGDGRLGGGAREGRCSVCSAAMLGWGHFDAGLRMCRFPGPRAATAHTRAWAAPQRLAVLA